MKGKDYQLSTLNVRRKNLAASLERKSTIITKILLSRSNAVAVREELSQFNNSFKMMEAIEEEMIALEAAFNSVWFDELDEKAFNFNRNAYRWLKEAEREQDTESKKPSSRKGSNDFRLPSRSSKQQP